jgi:hypothetical protein
MHLILIDIYLIVVGLTFLCSLVSFRLHNPFHLRLFSFFLGITVLAELIANFFLKPFHLASNFPVYNVFMLIEYPILAFYFKQIVISKSTKRIIWFFITLYPLFWILMFLFVYKLSEWCSYGIMFGDFFLIIFSVRYLYELFTSERLVSFGKHAEFWIAVGIIFYSCCELPITGILNFLTRDWRSNYNTILNLFSILQVLNIVMYSIFIYAFLCRVNLTTTKS